MHDAFLITSFSSFLLVFLSYFLRKSAPWKNVENFQGSDANRRLGIINCLPFSFPVMKNLLKLLVLWPQLISWKNKVFTSGLADMNFLMFRSSKESLRRSSRLNWVFSRMLSTFYCPSLRESSIAPDELLYNFSMNSQKVQIKLNGIFLM